jgi:hypothetical protein
VVAGFALLCTACRDDRVVVTYDPSAGATYTYTVHIESTSTSTFPGRNATPRDVADLQVRQRVLDTNGDTIADMFIHSDNVVNTGDYIFHA